MGTGFLSELARALPADSLLTAAARRLAYDADAYPLHRGVPRAVALPRTTAEVSACMAIAARHGVPVVARGAGTGLSGGATAGPEALLLSLARLDRLLALDPLERTARVQAGFVNARLDAAAAPYGLRFAPDPSSQFASTLGGNVAENAGGPHTLKDGVTAQHLREATVVLEGGQVLALGSALPDAPGLDLLGAFCGSEGTLGVVTELVVSLVPRPEAVRTGRFAFPDVESASRAVSSLVAADFLPAALEMLDARVVAAVEAAFALGLPREAGAILIVELDGAAEAVAAEAGRAAALLRAEGAFEAHWAADADERDRLWLARKKAVGALGRLAPAKLTMDCVVPRARLAETMAAILACAADHRLRIANVFHAGDGNLHPMLLFDPRDGDEARRAEACGLAIARLCLARGGALTGEHGIGAEKVSLMEEAFTPGTLDAFAGLQRAFDPAGRLNPGKLLPRRAGCGEARGPRPGGPAC